MLKTSIAAASLATAILAAGPAFAHPEFQSSEPPAGKSSPATKEIKILFNESLIQKFSGAELKDQAGKVVPTGKATVDPTNKKRMILPLKDQLAPGDYKVEWYAVSDDTHKVKGTFTFGVAR